jgi:hypothetical protein
MAARPRWWHQLQASKSEALLAVDLYNRSGKERQLEAFIVHMSIAWLKLLQARFERDGLEIYIRDSKGRRQRTRDGDWLTKPLQVMAAEQFGDHDPRRTNLEFFVSLRNKIEHRYERDIAVLVAGKTQALLLNYERLLVDTFGSTESLGDQLRFPLFVSSVTDDAVAALKAVRRRVPRAVLEYIQDFDVNLDPDIATDHQYDFRIYLVPKTGAKTDADVAMSFVRIEELTGEQRALMEQVQTVIREKEVPVSDLGALLPGQVAQRVQAGIGRRFNQYEHLCAWRHYGVRPETNSPNPARTKSEFCRYNPTFRQYVYTEAWVRYLTRKLSDPLEYEAVTGRDAQESSRHAVPGGPAQL